QLARQVLGRLAEVRDRNGLDAGQGRLGGRLGGAEDVLGSRTLRGLGNDHRPGDGTDMTTERDLTQSRVAVDAVTGNLPRRDEDRDRDREVEAGALLLERRRRQVHDQSLLWPLEPG